jgi:dTDP-4-dehydrorhamnose 3,5-epimerase
MLWVPPGFAHGFLALEDGSEALYKCTDFHAPEHERSLLWSDDAIGIEWPLPEGARPILSVKDAAAPPLAQAETYT